MEGDGRVGEYVGGYSDWLRQRPTARRAAAWQAAKARCRRRRPRSAPAAAKRKLSYKDARELEQLPARIEALETSVAAADRSR